MTELLKSLRRIWSQLLQFAAWMAVAIGTFAPEPPPTTLTAPPDIALKRFTQFLGAIVLGLLLVFCLRLRQKKHAKGWMAFAVILAAATLTCFLVERAVRSTWTCVYANRNITIGELTDDAKSYRSALSGEVTCDRLLSYYGGDAFLVWKKASSERHYLILSVLMIGIWLCAASCIVGVTQTIRCATA